MSENIQVVVRFRPLNEREISNDTRTHIKINTGDNSIVITDKNIVHDFKFDYVFDYASSQEEIYKIVALTAVESVCHGYNATIFAYGSSGSGKTFTMFGNENQKGIIPNACQTIFKYINNNMIENNVKCSFIEIYNERIRDLFNVHSEDLHIRQNEKGVYIQSLTEKLVYNSADILNCIKSGSNQRMIGATSVNDVSSRSHAVLTITITQIGIDGSEIISKLNLVDLAGSENVGRSEAHGMALTEAQNINKSLSALGNVINALTDSRRGHIPYRDSKLTYFLQDSLGGNSKTIMIATVSPATSVVFETLNTIKFAKRAKDIKNIPKLNRNESTINLLKIIEQLNGKIELLQEKIENYQGIVENILAADIGREEVEVTNTYPVTQVEYENGQVFVPQILNNGYTMSYSLKRQEWVGWHPYIPSFYMHVQEKFYSWIQGSRYMWKHNRPNHYQTFYGITYPFIVEYVDNPSPLTTKVWDNLLFQTEAKKFDSASGEYLDQPNVTFNKGLFYNTLQTSGMLTLAPKQNDSTNYFFQQTNNTPGVITVDRNERDWTLNNLKDYRKQDNLSGGYTVPMFLKDIPSLQNNYYIDKVVNPSAIDYNKDWSQLESFRDKFLVVRLIFDNFADTRLIFNFSALDKRQSER